MTAGPRPAVSPPARNQTRLTLEPAARRLRRGWLAALLDRTEAGEPPTPDLTATVSADLPAGDGDRDCGSNGGPTHNYWLAGERQADGAVRRPRIGVDLTRGVSLVDQHGVPEAVLRLERDTG